MTFIGVCQKKQLAGVTLYLRSFHRHEFIEPRDTALISLPKSLSNAALKRKAEFVAGRVAANDALRVLGYTDFSIAIGEHRSPCWPDAVVGSISHSDDIAVAVAGAKAHWQGLGVDVQTRLTQDDLEAVNGVIATPHEHALLSLLDTPLAEQLTLIFSAKESVFKALYPRVKRYLDFSDATLVCASQNQLTFRLSHALTLELGLATCRCDYLWNSHHVITLVTLPCDLESPRDGAQ